MLFNHQRRAAMATSIVDHPPNSGFVIANRTGEQCLTLGRYRTHKVFALGDVHTNEHLGSGRRILTHQLVLSSW